MRSCYSRTNVLISLDAQSIHRGTVFTNIPTASIWAADVLPMSAVVNTALSPPVNLESAYPKAYVSREPAVTECFLQNSRTSFSDDPSVIVSSRPSFPSRGTRRGTSESWNISSKNLLQPPLPAEYAANLPAALRNSVSRAISVPPS